MTLHIEGEWDRRLEQLSGLEGALKEDIARRLLQKGLEQEAAELLARVEEFVNEARAGGPSRELTDEDWADIMNTRPEEVSPDSLAVPPGWRPSKT